MHLIKIFLLIVFNLIIIVFMTQNSNEKVDIFFFNYSLTDSYLNVVLLFNLLFGVAAGFLASVFIIIGNKSQIKSLQNKNRILTDELYDLRNDPLEYRNLSEEIKYKSIIETLSKKLHDYFKSHSNPKFDLWNGGKAKSNVSSEAFWKKIWGEDWSCIY